MQYISCSHFSSIVETVIKEVDVVDQQRDLWFYCLLLKLLHCHEIMGMLALFCGLPMQIPTPPSDIFICKSVFLQMHRHFQLKIIWSWKQDTMPPGGTVFSAWENWGCSDLDILFYFATELEDWLTLRNNMTMEKMANSLVNIVLP